MAASDSLSSQFQWHNSGPALRYALSDDSDASIEVKRAGSGWIADTAAFTPGLPDNRFAAIDDVRAQARYKTEHRAKVAAVGMAQRIESGKSLPGRIDTYSDSGMTKYDKD